MEPWMQKIIESKGAARKKNADLPFSEKIKILEKLRDRSRLLAANPLRYDKKTSPEARETN